MVVFQTNRPRYVKARCKLLPETPSRKVSFFPGAKVWRLKPALVFEQVLAPWHYYHGLKGKYIYFVYSKKDPVNSPGDVEAMYKYFKSDKTQNKVYEWDCGHCSDPTPSQMKEWVEWFKEKL